MSDLQIGLIGLGVLLILLVLLFNWWQDRRVRRKMQSHFPTNEHDPLLGASHAGAGHGAAPAGSHGYDAAAAARREPGFGYDGKATGSVAASGSQPEAGDDAEEADPAIEVVIDIALGRPVRGAELIPYVQNIRQIGRKSVRFFAETDMQLHRARLHPEETYSRLQMAVLLANRSGALTAIEWSQAWARAQDIADRFDGTLEAPDQQAILEHAARLDEVCARLDAQVGLTLLLGGAQPAGEVLALTRQMGFVNDGGRLLWMSDQGIARFQLTRGDGAAFDAGVGGIERLDFLLDVPCGPADPRAFGRMVDVARDLASRLRADLVDDQGRALAEGSDKPIDERLDALFAQLEQAGLRAGSPRAQRVFA
jgi:hypothetical protein